MILVNDGSSDSSPAICDRYAATDSRVQVIHSVNKGVSAARNKALESARGTYISFIDSDDWLDLETYSLCRDAMLEGVDIIMYGLKYMRDRDTEIYSESYLKFQGMSNTEAIRTLVETTALASSLWCRLFRRELVQGMEFFPGRMGEDTTFTLEAHLRANTFVLLHKPLYMYRCNESSATFRIGNNLIDLYLNLQAFLEKVKDEHPEWVPDINATAIRWFQGHYNDIVDSGHMTSAYDEVFRKMRYYPFSSTNWKNYLARWTFIHFPELYSSLRRLARRIK